MIPSYYTCFRPLSVLTCSMENFSWFFTLWSTSEPCILSHDFLQWCCSFRVQFKTVWNFGLLVVYIREFSPNRELSKRAKGLGGSGVGSGRTNESFYAKNKLHWKLQNREGTEICIIWRNHRCFSTKNMISSCTPALKREAVLDCSTEVFFNKFMLWLTYITSLLSCMCCKLYYIHVR